MSSVEFIREKKYLLNVSPRTIEWYENAFKWLHRYCPDEVTQEGLNQFVIGMREAGLKPVTCNGNIRVIKTYLRWKGANLKLQYLKVEEKELVILKPGDVQKLLQYRPRTVNDRRIHLLTKVLLDTGLRLEECLGIHELDIDLDNLLLTVKGKGDKQRRIPFSHELRKAFWIHHREHRGCYTFSTSHGTKLSRRNALRDFKNLCKKVGVTPPPRALHSLRHYFACHYLKQGGNLGYLQRILGHSRSTTTEIYLRAVQPSDLVQAHSSLSVLSARS